jgi:hypothetical protein
VERNLPPMLPRPDILTTSFCGVYECPEVSAGEPTHKPSRAGVCLLENPIETGRVPLDSLPMTSS